MLYLVCDLNVCTKFQSIQSAHSKLTIKAYTVSIPLSLMPSIKAATMLLTLTIFSIFIKPIFSLMAVSYRESPYSPLKSVDNDIVCAVPPGLLKTYQSPSLVKCANDCQRSSPCGGFNTRENGSCEHYGKNQATFGLQHGCRYFTVSMLI